MKITIEINDINELLKLRDWLNKIPEFEIKSNFDLNQSIDLFEFSARTKNALLSESIEKAGDLIKMRRIDLLKIPNIGKFSLSEIIEALSSAGLSLRA